MDEKERERQLRTSNQRVLRRTPIHEQMLVQVRDGAVEWRANVGPSGGFAPVGKPPYAPSVELVALYELRSAGLIGVAPELGKVFATASGLARLERWLRAEAPS